MTVSVRHLVFAAAGLALGVSVAMAGQAPKPAAPPKPSEPPKIASPKSAPPVAGGVVPPSGYIIGPEDVLSILFWREKNLSGDVIVRPDGRISLPLLNDIQAAGLTTDELREKVMAEANKFVEDSTATVVVKQINSRKVFITGNVTKPGLYPLAGPLNVLQLIALAGGLLEFADASSIRVMRTENGNQVAFPFNYKRISEGKDLKQNIELKPGDTVVVP
jgi:polysaccharide export outer membrane protein